MTIRYKIMKNYKYKIVNVVSITLKINQNYLLIVQMKLYFGVKKLTVLFKSSDESADNDNKILSSFIALIVRVDIFFNLK